MLHAFLLLHFFFFNDTATTEIYTLSLHDALPISAHPVTGARMDLSTAAIEPDFVGVVAVMLEDLHRVPVRLLDRKSTRLNSSHQIISYAVFCLKKKKDTYHPYGS